MLVSSVLLGVIITALDSSGVTFAVVLLSVI